MATYYVRPTHEPRFEGPFSVAQIRDLLAAGRLEPSAMALEARGQNYWRLQASRNWVGVLTLVNTASTEDLPSDETSPPPTSLPDLATHRAIARYREGYQAATAVIQAGAWLKASAWIAAILLVAVSLVPGWTLVRAFGPLSGMVILSALVNAAIVGGVLYLAGLLITLWGWMLQGRLDAVVYNSPFLTDEERARAMSLV